MTSQPNLSHQAISLGCAHSLGEHIESPRVLQDYDEHKYD
jgi:hypothetical protein